MAPHSDHLEGFQTTFPRIPPSVSKTHGSHLPLEVTRTRGPCLLLASSSLSRCSLRHKAECQLNSLSSHCCGFPSLYGAFPNHERHSFAMRHVARPDSPSVLGGQLGLCFSILTSLGTSSVNKRIKTALQGRT